ncbi:hypothetical protein D3C87_1922250 [compost metagenome]
MTIISPTAATTKTPSSDRKRMNDERASASLLVAMSRTLLAVSTSRPPTKSRRSAMALFQLSKSVAAGV